VLVSAGFLAWAGPASAAETDGPFTFTTSGTSATITGYDYTGQQDIVIPATVTDGTNTYDVSSIAEYAFYSDHLISVTIPDSVTTIGDGAFFFNQLTSVTIGDSVTTIGDDVFVNNQLTSVTIPDSVTTIGDRAFAYNPLTSVTIGDSVTTIGETAFGYNQLTSVTIGDSVTTIGETAFQYNQLTSVTIPDSVTAVGALAFDGNPDLVSVVFEGNAPTVTDAAVSGESFDTASGSLVLSYFFGATGFSTPTWHGYTTAVTPRPAVTGLAPTITGLAQVGQTLTADPGPVDPDDATLTYQWNAGGDPISDATGPTYDLTPAQEGQTITVTITATALGLAAQTETSDPTAVVEPADTTPETPDDPDPTPGTPTDPDTATSAHAALPDTGGPSRTILAIGLAAILAGALTLTTRRRTRRH
jgi:LPXTG-motif cell wall-anchored protein